MARFSDRQGILNSRAARTCLRYAPEEYISILALSRQGDDTLEDLRESVKTYPFEMIAEFVSGAADVTD